jgi:hypothetical protein
MRVALTKVTICKRYLKATPVNAEKVGLPLYRSDALLLEIQSDAQILLC